MGSQKYFSVGLRNAALSAALVALSALVLGRTAHTPTCTRTHVHLRATRTPCSHLCPLTVATRTPCSQLCPFTVATRVVAIPSMGVLTVCCWCRPSVFSHNCRQVDEQFCLQKWGLGGCQRPYHHVRYANAYATRVNFGVIIASPAWIGVMVVIKQLLGVHAIMGIRCTHTRLW